LNSERTKLGCTLSFNATSFQLLHHGSPDKGLSPSHSFFSRPRCYLVQCLVQSPRAALPQQAQILALCLLVALELPLAWDWMSDNFDWELILNLNY
jgi:hypothetical protein